jgi:hypothetical protein
MANGLENQLNSAKQSIDYGIGSNQVQKSITKHNGAVKHEQP